MAIFQPRDDDAFIAWLDANQNGYVINTERGGRAYVKLHRATCNFIRKWPPFIGPSYVKLCSASLDQLEEWTHPMATTILRSPTGIIATSTGRPFQMAVPADTS